MRSLSIQCPACERIIRTHDQADRAVCVCETVITRADFKERQSTSPPRPVNAWRPLHRYPIAMRDRWSVIDAENWYADWLRTVPSIGCNCQKNWRDATRKDPPDFNSADAFARWAWRQHNGVRKRLGQPVWSWEDSQAAARLPVIGFLAAAYMPIGGTETFHRALLPRLHNVGWPSRPSEHTDGRPGRPSYERRLWVDGFVVTGEWDDGDLSLLGVPGCGSGIDAARALAARVDVLLVWGLTELASFLPMPRPKVIAVHHSDTKSTWSHETIANNRTLIDLAVCVNPEVTSDLLGGVPSVYLANAVDSSRYVGNPQRGAELRERWNIRPTDHIHLWCHRWSAEKQPELALQIAAALPDGHVLVMVTAAAAEVPTMERLRYVGTVESPCDWLATSATFVSTSTYDGFGTSMAEAMGAGVPVVGTAVGIAAEPGMATRVMPPDATPEQWVAALVETVGSRNDRAQQLVRERHAADPWARRWADTILSVIEPR